MQYAYIQTSIYFVVPNTLSRSMFFYNDDFPLRHFNVALRLMATTNICFSAARFVSLFVRIESFGIS